MNKPKIGHPLPDYVGRCGYGGPPFGAPCGRPALWHFVVTDDDAAMIILGAAVDEQLLQVEHESVEHLHCCETHRSTAEDLFTYWSRHRYRPVCNDPRRWWTPDRCIIPVDAEAREVAATEPRPELAMEVPLP